MLSLGLVIAALSGAPVEGAQCRMLISAKRAGEAVFAEDVAPAACPLRQPPALLRYDARRQLVIARTDLAAGTELGRAYLPGRPAVAAGDKIELTVAIGHVTISRGAEALQPARDGQRFFAKTADGKIIVAPALGTARGKAGERK